MKVNLARDWFDPSGTLRERTKNPHTLPDDWEDLLPSGAVVVETPKAPPPPPKK